jgi:ferritin-like metal-binding protein YciE
MAKAQTKSKRGTKARKSSRTTPARKSANRRMTNTKQSGKSQGQTGKEGSLLEEFFLDSLKDIYWAEKALTKALPKMSKSATSPELKDAFDQHLEVTRNQITRLEQVFEELGQKAQAKKCEAMQGLVDESESIIEETQSDTLTRDAALIIAAQKVEHYEIATYGGLVQLAKTMNKPNLAKLLESTLSEEKEADVMLTDLAERSINEQASAEGEGESDKASGSLKESIVSMFSSKNDEGKTEKGSKSEGKSSKGSR